MHNYVRKQSFTWISKKFPQLNLLQILLCTIFKEGFLILAISEALLYVVAYGGSLAINLQSTFKTLFAKQQQQLAAKHFMHH